MVARRVAIAALLGGMALSILTAVFWVTLLRSSFHMFCQMPDGEREYVCQDGVSYILPASVAAGTLILLAIPALVLLGQGAVGRTLKVAMIVLALGSPAIVVELAVRSRVAPDQLSPLTLVGGGALLIGYLLCLAAILGPDNAVIRAASILGCVSFLVAAGSDPGLLPTASIGVALVVAARASTRLGRHPAK